jgi:A/G-specific adenine glycosylase
MTGDIAGFQKTLIGWYRQHRRDLPWRVNGGGRPDPYHVLVSEAMLQQTQVSTVIPYYHRFLSTLPTLADLAAADEQLILRLWQGLGYYSRARNLQRAARNLMEDFAGRVPETVDELLTLPGVGRYTAGAIASLAFDVKAPILDGNVIRVLCRLDKVFDDPRQPTVRERLWQRAEELLPEKAAGDFNSALMELGATVCTPRSPKCLLCPVQRFCDAQAAGVQEQIPVAKSAKERPLERRWTVCITDGERWLIEQRPPDGRWANMWQFTTLPAGDAKHPTAAWVRNRFGLAVRKPRHLGQVMHGLTHRQYEFDVYRTRASDASVAVGPRRWVALDELSDYPLPRPHLRIAALLRGDA